MERTVHEIKKHWIDGYWVSTEGHGLRYLHVCLKSKHDFTGGLPKYEDKYKKCKLL